MIDPKPKENCDKGTFIFISRHKVNNGQKALIYDEGFCDIFQKEIIFGNDPIGDLKNEGIHSKSIGLVAPLTVHAKLLNEGYQIYEFVNVPSARQKGIYLCGGVNIIKRNESGLSELYKQGFDDKNKNFSNRLEKLNVLDIKFKNTIIPVEDQEASLLVPK